MTINLPGWGREGTTFDTSRDAKWIAILLPWPRARGQGIGVRGQEHNPAAGHLPTAH
jgi:hypothetical protein